MRRDWLENADQSGSGPERALACDPSTGALLHGHVPKSVARGQARARRAHQARERRRERAHPRAPGHGQAPAATSDITADQTDQTVENVDDFIAGSYRVPDPMARLIRLRDGSCRFPGCATPARQCDLDHVRPWPTGATTPTNLICLCRRHHRIKQRDGWTVRLHPDATATWTDPTGRHRTTWPVDHLHLVTAGHTHRDPTTHGRVPADPTTIPTTFEEQLIDLLGGPDHAHPRAHPSGFDIDGNTLGDPPPPPDLDHTLETGTAPWDQILLDHPPPPPRPPEPIPF